MVDQMFDHKKLDVYRLSIEYASATFEFAATLSGLHPEQTDERAPEQAGWLASLGTVNSRPRYPWPAA